MSMGNIFACDTNAIKRKKLWLRVVMAIGRKTATICCRPRVQRPLLVNTMAVSHLSLFTRKRLRRPSISGTRLACKTQGGSCGSLLLRRDMAGI